MPRIETQASVCAAPCAITGFAVLHLHSALLSYTCIVVYKSRMTTPWASRILRAIAGECVPGLYLHQYW